MTQHTSYLDNFPFPELYREVALEESVSDSDSELVKITKAKAKSKSKLGVSRFHKKPKGKSSREPVAEKWNADVPVPAATSSAPLSDGDVTEGVSTDAEEPDKGEGTSSLPMVRGRKGTSYNFLTAL